MLRQLRDNPQQVALQHDLFAAAHDDRVAQLLRQCAGGQQGVVLFD